MSEPALRSHHFLGLRLTPLSDLKLILDTADSMKQILGRQIRKVPTLRGRTIVTLFFEPSTRTRSSFEAAARVMSADITSLAVAASSVVKGESLIDTVLTMRSMPMDLLIMRHSQSGAPHLVSTVANCPVINAGDGSNEHPSQGLLDLYTIQRHFGSVQGLKIAIIGDILHSRVARSNLWALSRLGAEVRLAGPKSLLPPEFGEVGAHVFRRVEDALAGADVVNVLRIQKERQESGLFPTLREYHHLFGITVARMKLASPQAIVLHPGPMNRGVEIDADVADGPQSLINEQVTNGVAVRMALLYLLLEEKQSMRWLLKGGRVIIPSSGLDAQTDIVIENGQVESFNGEATGATVIDATGMVVCPGFIDVHTHLREPGYEHKETIQTGVRSAVAGGFTTVCCMPNTNPAIDNAAIVAYVKAKAAAASPVRVLPMGSLTRGMGQEQLAELGEMAEAGVSAFTDDAFPIQSSQLMRSAMQYASSFDIPVVTHCEDKSLTAGASMHEGRYSVVLGIKGLPRTAEEIQVARNILLSEETGCRLHVAHISTRRSIEMVRLARRSGLPVTAEACPHHFSLTDASVAGEEPGHPGRAYDSNAKMNPPLRSADDVAAVIEGLKDGTISCIATDHAPHSREEKEVEYGAAPFGIVGFETALAVCLTYLVEPGHLSLADVVRLLTTGPAEVIASPNRPEGIGDLVVGGRADITVFDPEIRWCVDVAALQSKSKNSPYGGYTLTGKVRHVFVNGESLL